MTSNTDATKAVEAAQLQLTNMSHRRRLDNNVRATEKVEFEKRQKWSMKVACTMY